MKTGNVEKIKNAFDDLPEHWLLLFIVDAKEYLETNVAILKEVMEREEDIVGVYVTLNRPYASLIKILEQNKIKTDSLFFLDCITKTLGAEKEEKRCLFLESPQNLTNIAIAIDEIVKAMPVKNKFLFFDELSTLLIYNQTGTVAKFLHFLTGKMHVLELKGILLSVEKELDPKIAQQSEQSVDKVVDLSVENMSEEIIK